MAEIYVPFLLILMGWNPQDPQATMDVRTSLYLSEADCFDAADLSLKAYRQGRARVHGAQQTEFAWKCVPHEEAILIHERSQDSQ